MKGNNMSILGIIQARVGSTRLPRKVLLDLEGKTVLEHVVCRVKQSTKITDILVATTLSWDDLAIVKLCAENGILVFCGSVDDVLDRYYQAAKIVKPDHIVRITADCPLMDPAVIDMVIMQHLSVGADYSTNTNPETFPDGEDVEVISFECLKQAWEKADLLSEREHVTPFIRKNPSKFKLSNIEWTSDLSKKRWTIDNPEDYEFIKLIYQKLYKNNHSFNMQAILDYLSAHPEIEKINSKIGRNEGYAKSIRKDKQAGDK
jgi:spore coat polysaccharide biosynthesis protein SpsF (cytidylyltransferase family)